MVIFVEPLCSRAKRTNNPTITDNQLFYCMSKTDLFSADYTIALLCEQIR